MILDDGMYGVFAKANLIQEQQIGFKTAHYYYSTMSLLRTCFHFIIQKKANET